MNAISQTTAQTIDQQADFDSPQVHALRDDLALALRAAFHYELAEGICNHFSVELPDGSGRFLINPQGLLWSEIQAQDIVMIDVGGERLAGRHAVESTAMYIHSAIHRICKKACVFHTHMPYSTSLTLICDAGLDTKLSQNAMRFHNRVAIDNHYNGLALDHTEGERIANVMKSADVAFLANHGVVVCSERIDYAFDDLYFLERACMVEVLARSTGKAVNPVSKDLAKFVGEQTLGERLQAELFFKALRRTL